MLPKKHYCCWWCHLNWLLFQVKVIMLVLFCNIFSLFFVVLHCETRRIDGSLLLMLCKWRCVIYIAHAHAYIVLGLRGPCCWVCPRVFWNIGPALLTLVSPTTGPNSTTMYSCSPSGSRDDLLTTVHTASRNSMGIVTPSPCHGLTLLYDDAAPAYYVCNAATRAITRLPPHSTPPKYRSTARLGFDARTREYKVVRLITGSSPTRRGTGVKCTPLELVAGGWRPVEEYLLGSPGMQHLQLYMRRRTKYHRCLPMDYYTDSSILPISPQGQEIPS